MTENDRNLIAALRTAKSRSRRVLFDAAADRMEELLAENAKLPISGARIETRLNEFGLRECPFCGSTDVKDRGKVKGARRIAFVQCHRCNARSGAYEGLASEKYQTLKAEAVEAWNRRSPHGTQPKREDV